MNVEEYWLIPPPMMSKGCERTLAKLNAGWRPNRRIRQMGYYESAEFYRCYIWEWLNVISPAIDRLGDA